MPTRTHHHADSAHAAKGIFILEMPTRTHHHADSAHAAKGIFILEMPTRTHHHVGWMDCAECGKGANMENTECGKRGVCGKSIKC